MEQRTLVADVEAFAAAWRPLQGREGACLDAMNDRGWSAPGWPKPWGGGLAADQAYLVERTLALAGLPLLDSRTLLQAGPLLLRLADEAICDRFLPVMGAGRARWSLHGSLVGAAPISGRLRGPKVQLEAERTLAFAASEATTLALAVRDGPETGLVVADLDPAAVEANQPLDPDTVFLAGLDFQVLATTRTHPTLAAALNGEVLLSAAGAGCWTGRLRTQYDRLLQTAGTASDDERSALAVLGVTLSGLEVMEQRAVVSADRALGHAVALRSAELGRALSEAALEQLGYYALPAVEPARAHNELPSAALAARDAMAELIRYLDGGSSLQRNEAAKLLGLTGESRGSHGRV